MLAVPSNPTAGKRNRAVSFSLGDRVEWTSQGSGSARMKSGVIVQVVAPLALPSRENFPSLYQGSGVGSARRHRSYVVQVQDLKYYWPRVSMLRPHVCQEAETRGRLAWVNLCREMGWEAETRAILLEQFIHAKQLMPELASYARQRAKFALRLPHDEEAAPKAA
jgi:hypothetical protein